MDDALGAHTLALRLRCGADDVRAASAAVAATGDLAWRSPAAELFRLRVGAAARDLRATAAALDDAAVAVDLHAATVQARLAQLAAVSDAFTGAVARSLP